MSFEQKFEIVKTSLISHCKESITENWDKMFDMWLSCEADMEFGYGYQNIFKEEFAKYITPEIDSLLWLAGKNIVFAIVAFMSYKDNASCDDVVNFTENFVTAQLDDFDNWCEDISMAMYEESSEYGREHGNQKEDTSS